VGSIGRGKGPELLGGDRGGLHTSKGPLKTTSRPGRCPLRRRSTQRKEVGRGARGGKLLEGVKGKRQRKRGGSTQAEADGSLGNGPFARSPLTSQIRLEILAPRGKVTERNLDKRFPAEKESPMHSGPKPIEEKDRHRGRHNYCRGE